MLRDIRLRETDEIPGNSVAFANISYATNGIQVLGQPGHSPLLGDYTETTFVNGLAVFQITEAGLMLQADIAGTRYWKSDKLNTY